LFDACLAVRLKLCENALNCGKKKYGRSAGLQRTFQKFHYIWKRIMAQNGLLFLVLAWSLLSRLSQVNFILSLIPASVVTRTHSRLVL
jgi:hypothetical protein